MDSSALLEAARHVATAEYNRMPNNWLHASLLNGDARLMPDENDEPPCNLVDRWSRAIMSANCRQPKFWYLSHDSPQYPKSLLATPDAPAGLFVIGRLAPNDSPSLAIVGSRAASQRTLTATRGVAATLAERGVSIVSGLALGVDGAAHRGALDAGGHTLAVLGSGVDVVSPAEHADLARAIMVNGAVVSQFPPGQKPNKTTFPTRNAVIAGLSAATLVMEAAEASGTRIEMNFALKFGRPVLFWEPTMGQQQWAVEMADAQPLVSMVGAASLIREILEF